MGMDVDNWTKIEIPQTDLVPMASTTLNAFYQWTRIKAYKTTDVHRPAPKPKEDANTKESDDLARKEVDEKEAAKKIAAAELWTEMTNRPSQCPPCKCRAQSETDVCNNLDPKKFPRRLSRSNPACPKAIRHHVHVILPFYNLDEPAIANRSLLCTMSRPPR